MGRKAQVRRARKPAAGVAHTTPVANSQTVKRLRKLAQAINTQAQFEEMVEQHSHQAAFRRLVEPMLRPKLPCCAPGYLKEVHGVTVDHRSNPHTEHCPTRKRVELAHAGDVTRLLAGSKGVQ